MPNEKTQVGHVITNPPRAVQVRVAVHHNGANDTEPHSAVVANITILTDNRLQTQRLLDRWSTLAIAIDAAVSTLLYDTDTEESGDDPRAVPEAGF